LQTIRKCARLMAAALMAAPILGAPTIAQPLGGRGTEKDLESLPQSDALNPIMETHTSPPYPPEAASANEHGTTLMTVHITAQGVADNCAIAQSSGSARLDQAACDHVKRVWRWKPPTMRGQPTNVTTHVSIAWDLSDPPPVVPDANTLRPIMETHTLPPYPPISVRLNEEGTTMMLVHITTQGVVDDCKVIQSSSSERLDQAACDHVKTTWRWQPPTAQGQPVNVSTRVQVKWSLLDAPAPDMVSAKLIEATGTMPDFPAAQWKQKASALNEQATTLMRLHITAQGAADDCKMLQSSGSALLDQTACDHVKHAWHWTPAMAQGQPIDGTGLLPISWDVA
jgi:TonB family protein